MDSRSVDYSSHLTVECDDELGFFDYFLAVTALLLILLASCHCLAVTITVPA